MIDTTFKSPCGTKLSYKLALVLEKTDKSARREGWSYG